MTVTVTPLPRQVDQVRPPLSVACRVDGFGAGTQRVERQLESWRWSDSAAPPACPFSYHWPTLGLLAGGHPIFIDRLRRWERWRR